MNRPAHRLDDRFGDCCGVRLRVLPDFLVDHSLLHDSQEARLEEICSRWISFIERLVSWGEAVVFCLRFDAIPQSRQITIHLLARPSGAERREALQDHLEYTLRSYGVTPPEPDLDRTLPLLSDRRLAALGIGEEEKAALAGDVARSFDTALAAPPGEAAFVGVVQEVTADLWQDQTALDRLILRLKPGMARSPGATLSGWIPLNWEGPSGPFLVPLRAALATRTRLRMSVYLQRTAVSIPERQWLAGLAQMSHGDGAAPDPIRNLVAQRAGSALRRLLRPAVMTAAEVIAFDGNRNAALHVAGVLRTAAIEPGAVSPDSEGAMPGVRIIDQPSTDSEAWEAHGRLGFPDWMNHARLPDYAARLPYLADARGAATLFRLPISVQAGVPGVAVAQAAPDFNPGPRELEVSESAPLVYRSQRPGPEIAIGYFESAGVAAIPLDDLTKHALITGSTGSGKSKTVLHLLHQLWVDHHIPFLVLESAKNEYRGLMGMAEFAASGDLPGLRVYTAGDETLAPLRINPFELIPGVRVEAHVGQLQTCFEAAFPPIGPLTSILEQALIEVYHHHGWMMTDVGPAEHELEGRRFPTMSDFGARLSAVGLARGYEGDFKASLQAAIRSRIIPLTRKKPDGSGGSGGSKGLMLDTARTHPPADVLFGGPVVLEMNSLNQEDKALVSLFFLVLLREYRDQRQRDGRGGPQLRHVTVIEEAHNVLQDVASTGGQEGGAADTRYKAVQAFCAMLAEIRSHGEGIIIADQSPVKLAPDAMRNTNLQIAHKQHDTKDRLAIADAMIMTDEQRDYLGRLKPGRAGLFYTGLQKASFVTVPQFDDPRHGGRGRFYRSTVTDAEVARTMQPFTEDIKEPDRPFEGCRACGVRLTCDYRWANRSLLTDQNLRSRFIALTANAADIDEVMARFAPLLAETASRLGHPGSADAAWCGLLHMRHHFTKWPPGGPFDRASRAAFQRKVVPALAPQHPPGAPNPADPAAANLFDGSVTGEPAG